MEQKLVKKAMNQMANIKILAKSYVQTLLKCDLFAYEMLVHINK